MRSTALILSLNFFTCAVLALGLPVSNALASEEGETDETPAPEIKLQPVLLEADKPDVASTFRLQPVIETARPTVTDSPYNLPRDAVQIEAGIRFSDDGEDVQELNTPELLVRYGVTDKFEIRFGAPNYITRFGGALPETEHAASDTTLGLKVDLGRFKVLKLAALGTVNLPTGTNETGSTGAFGGEGSLIYAAALTQRATLFGQSSLGSFRTEDQRRMRYQQTAGAVYTLNEKWAVFGEYILRLNQDSPDAHAAQAGITFHPSPLTQIDLRAGRRIGNVGESFFAGLGFSFRLDDAPNRAQNGVQQVLSYQ